MLSKFRLMSTPLCLNDEYSPNTTAFLEKDGAIGWHEYVMLQYLFRLTHRKDTTET